LACATSLINPNYGVCAVTTQLVVPEVVVTSLTAELAETEEAGAAAVKTVLAGQATTQDSRRSTRRSCKDTHRAKKRVRRTGDTRLSDDPEETEETDEDETGTE
jgi:hypothetical protein